MKNFWKTKDRIIFFNTFSRLYNILAILHIFHVVCEKIDKMNIAGLIFQTLQIFLYLWFRGDSLVLFMEAAYSGGCVLIFSYLILIYQRYILGVGTTA